MEIRLFAAEGKDAKTLAHALLRHGLRDVYGISVPPPMERTAQGKPFFPAHPEIQFNYSHTRGFALCGFSSIPIGVDIEAPRPVRPGLARRVLSDREYEDYLRCSDPQGRLFTLWTLKESFFKCTGTGLKTPFHAAEFTIGPDGAVSCNQPGYAFRTFSGGLWRAAACTAGGDAPAAQIVWI